MEPPEVKQYAVAWYDQPTIHGIKPYIKKNNTLVPNPEYVDAQHKMKSDPVNKPAHYCSHPSGVECILISEQMNFCVGNAFKYLYRCTEKGNTLQDLLKAQYYIARELRRREGVWFRLFYENQNYDAFFDGDGHIRKVLSVESRFSGWMKQALERLYTASIQKKGTLALERAASCVATMIRIQEYREGKRV
jgi:hypothetical protein